MLRGGLAAMSMLGLAASARVEVYEDPAAYQEMMGESARAQFRTKWGMDETIFPASIS